MFTLEQRKLVAQFVDYRERMNTRVQKMDYLENLVAYLENFIVQQAILLDAEYGIS